MKKPAFSLIVLWRSDGEQILNFSTKAEAEHHRDMLDQHMGTKIVKMEIVSN